MSEAQSRRGFLKTALGGMTLLATPLIAQDDLSGKVNELLEERKFEEALKLVENVKSYESLEAQCCTRYAADRHRQLLDKKQFSDKTKFIDYVSTTVDLYTRGFKEEKVAQNHILRAARGDLLVQLNKFSAAAEDYLFSTTKEPRRPDYFAALIAAKLFAGESDSIRKTLNSIVKEQDDKEIIRAYNNGIAQGIINWFNAVKIEGGKIQCGTETVEFFDDCSNAFMKSWMAKAKDNDLNERFGTTHRNEALFCLYVAGAAMYGAQPFETALGEYDMVVKPRYTKIKDFVEGNLIESDKLAPMYLIKLEFKNKETLFQQLKSRTKK